MSDAVAVRGGIYPYAGSIRHRNFLVVSVDPLTALGTAIVVEVNEEAPSMDLRGLLTVQLTEEDPLLDWWVLCWRINFVSASNLDVANAHGQASPATMTAVLNGIKAAIEPLALSQVWTRSVFEPVPDSQLHASIDR